MGFFSVTKYEVTIEAGKEGLLLPPYKGSTLRGGFGSAFRRIACSQQRVECRDCLLIEICPYAYIFETSPPSGSEVLRNYESIPRPFVLEPPMETKTEYLPGERLNFNLILIGRASEYLPYFVVAFTELGEMGIGRGRKKYRLKEIKSVHPAGGLGGVIFTKDDNMLKGNGLPLQSDIKREVEEAPEDSPVSLLDLEFLTMTRLKHEEIFVKKPEFHVLLRSLLRRLSSLAYFHHGWELQLNFNGLIDLAAKVETVEDNTRWEEWERYSSRQDSRMSMGGLLGRVTFRGRMQKFLPLIRLGELTHVGKGAVFGMGRYTVL